MRPVRQSPSTIDLMQPPGWAIEMARGEFVAFDDDIPEGTILARAAEIATSTPRQAPAPPTVSWAESAEVLCLGMAGDDYWVAEAKRTFLDSAGATPPVMVTKFYTRKPCGWVRDEGPHIEVGHRDGSSLDFHSAAGARAVATALAEASDFLQSVMAKDAS